MTRYLARIRNALHDDTWSSTASHRASRTQVGTTTNLDYDDWLNFLGNKHMVTALLSRLRNQCTTIRIDGPSLREPQG